MKNIIITFAITLATTFASATTTNPIKLWNDNGATQTNKTFHKGDVVTIKAGNAYVTTGKVTAICNYNTIKVNGYFVNINDVEVINKYNTVR